MQAAYDHFSMEFFYEDVGIYDIDREIELGRLLEFICEQFLTEFDNGGNLYKQLNLMKVFVSSIL